jgi:hypothetical protein
MQGPFKLDTDIGTTGNRFKKGIHVSIKSGIPFQEYGLNV